PVHGLLTIASLRVFGFSTGAGVWAGAAADWAVPLEAAKNPANRPKARMSEAGPGRDGMSCLPTGRSDAPRVVNLAPATQAKEGHLGAFPRPLRGIRSAPRDIRMGDGLQETPIQPATREATQDGGDPEQPELLQRPAADEDRRCGAAGRVDRGGGDGNAHEMNQRQAQSDREAGEADRSAAAGPTEDDNQ